MKNVSTGTKNVRNGTKNVEKKMYEQCEKWYEQCKTYGTNNVRERVWKMWNKIRTT